MSEVRSYHRAFSHELTLYTLGGDLRLWRPIPARGIFWAAGFELLALAVAHVLGVHVRMLSAVWFAFYGAMPVGAAWAFTVATVEGRRLHDSLRAGARHAGRQSILVGGCEPLRAPQGVWRPGRVRVVRRP